MIPTFSLKCNVLINWTFILFRSIDLTFCSKISIFWLIPNILIKFQYFDRFDALKFQHFDWFLPFRSNLITMINSYYFTQIATFWLILYFFTKITTFWSIWPIALKMQHSDWSIPTFSLKLQHSDRLDILHWNFNILIDSFHFDQIVNSMIDSYYFTQIATFWSKFFT